MGPRSSPVAVLDTSAMRDGDVAGLALFNRPYAWIGVERSDGRTRLAMYDDQTEKTVRHDLTAGRVFLRADCDFMTERASFSWSLDGKTFNPLGDPVTLVFQLGTFQGIRYSLFRTTRPGPRAAPRRSIPSKCYSRIRGDCCAPSHSGSE
jgi:hypothetical protein